MNQQPILPTVLARVKEERCLAFAVASCKQCCCVVLAANYANENDSGESYQTLRYSFSSFHRSTRHDGSRAYLASVQNRHYSELQFKTGIVPVTCKP
eukprot:scaffold953_cov108-Skeletonema_marinoi.AAC.2